MENHELQRKEHLTGLIATLTNSDSARQFEKGITIKNIIDNAIPIREVIKAMGLVNVARALDIQLTRLVANLNLKWNLNDLQIKTIVEDLIEKFQNESIEDFVMVFKKARHGEYGELFRLDSAVIFGWMDKYLDEKYQVIENNLMKEKENHMYSVPPLPEPSPDTDKWMAEWLESVGKVETKAIAPMSKREIMEEGKVVPKPKIYNNVVTGSAEYYESKEMHFRWIRECFEPITGKPNKNWIPESDWLLKNS